ncbi:STAS domain-containing protein [Aquihabitans daechungensis]|uniref:STAS domain-containing protein n=1 Tax=Aquihabitans daechungensis TaxID=1052257 RepID=UPI003BA36CD5
MTIGAPHFNVQIDPGTKPLRVVATGELDAASASILAKALDEATSTETGIALDLSGVSFIDSSGLRVIAAEVQRAEAAATPFAVSAASDAVRRIFAMTGLTSLLEP